MCSLLLLFMCSRVDMCALRQSLRRGHCLLEMPTGTGKTVSLLSLLLAYQYAVPECGKIVYCTRTVQEMDKVVEEIKRISAYREKVINEQIKQRAEKEAAIAATMPQQQPQPPAASDTSETMSDAAHAAGAPPSSAPSSVPMSTSLFSAPAVTAAAAPIRSPRILGVCLSSRRNLCIHPTVGAQDNRNKVDALCRTITASFVREKKAEGAADIEVCEFFSGFEKEGTTQQHSCCRLSCSCIVSYPCMCASNCL